MGDAAESQNLPKQDTRDFVVPADLAGARLDKAAVALGHLSRARVKRAIESGAVVLNGRARPKGAVVAAGDVIRIHVGQVPDPEIPAVPSPGAPLVVRYESAGVLVVDKPAGQPSAPLRPGETDTLANALVGYYPELASIGYSPREPGLVHRLDTDTSGLVVVARTAQAFEALKAALKEDRLVKTYLLVCAGEGLADQGTIAYPIANHPKDQRRVLPCVHPRDVMRYAPRPAETKYHVLARNPEDGSPWALVEAEVSRALRHQIRAHFAAIEHPLAGDVLYGGAEVRALGRHALHAARVSFDGGGDPALAFDVHSPLPPAMAALVPGASQN
jgi:23S rRNA pseudouridine1911/1915/1917 synthase